jgi:DNA-binding CsgD family transcriptional regulator
VDVIGRTTECARIELLLDTVRRGRSGALVLRGEAGIGKSVLLRFAADRAAEMRVLEARGIESESELPFASLSELLRLSLDRLDSLPRAQSAALRGALALGPSDACDRFAVYTAVLSLLAAMAEDAPVLCLLDDAQWFDSASAEALLFAARRLDAEGVALLFAARDGDEAGFQARGLEQLEIGSLDADGSAALLAIHATRPPAPQVAERLARETAGNPLALVELSRLLSEGQLAGRETLSEPLPAGATAEHSFRRRVRACSESCRRALLLAAAATGSDLGPILTAARAVGVEVCAFEEAEAAGLVAVSEARLTFLQPLVRSAAYFGASPAQRREAHRALSETVGDEQRAWHLAAAAFGPDEDVARALERAADSACARRGYAAAATALERAARLSPKRTSRAKRLFAAADAARHGGRTEQALRLLARALECADDPQLRAAIQHARGRIELFRGRAHVARALLAAEAARIEPLDPDLAATMLADAALASLLAGDAQGAVETGRRAQAALQAEGGVAELMTKLILGTALYRVGEVREGVRLVLSGAAIAENERIEPYYLVHAGNVLSWAGEFTRARALLQSVIDEIRTTAALAVLPFALYASSGLDTRTGRWTSAYADASEAVRIASDTDNSFWRCHALGSLALVEAAQGREEQCRAHAAEALALARSLDIEYPREIGDALGLLELGLGRPDEAISHLKPVTSIAVEDAGGQPVLARSSLPDLVEAYLMSGSSPPQELTAALAAPAEAAESASFRALAERCRGLLADEGEFDARFGEALRLYELAGMPFAMARTALCYGERLRRGGRRMESRVQLRAALETFLRLGARAWAERAERELRTTGETVRRRDTSTAEELSPQELQIALVVAQGITNREAGATLFLSPKTIEYHLSRVYRKLGVRSRTELARLVAHQDAVPGDSPFVIQPNKTRARRS